MNVKAYQIWSTVLGASLTSVSPTGTKVETSVYAGSAVIAKQMRYTQNSTNNDSIQWRTADPVTGTLGTFTYSGSGSSRTTEEIEPLGQTIDPVDTTPLETEEPIEISPNQIVFGNAMDPEWQCQAGAAFYDNKFVNMPFHCQKKALLEAGSKLPWEDEREENPHGVSNRHTFATAKDKNERPQIKVTTKEELARRKALAATAKPDNEGASAGQPLLDSSIPGFVDAASTDDGAVTLTGDSLKTWTSERDKLLKLLNDKNSDCYKFLKNVAKLDVSKIVSNLETQTPYDADASENDATVEFKFYDPSTNNTVKDFFASEPGAKAGTGYSGRIYYRSSGINVSTILHENIHSTFKGKKKWKIYDPNSKRRDSLRKIGKSPLTDEEIQDKLKISVQNDTTNIDDKLAKEGCK